MSAASQRLREAFTGSEHLAETGATIARGVPESAHVAELDLAQSTDRQIWDYAGQNDYVIVSKDSDFRQLAFLFGPPPKAVWLDVGNVNSLTILEFIRNNRETIGHFSDNTEESFMLLSR